MYLVDFMNKNADWQIKLAAAPYYLEIRSDEIDGEKYYLLKYNMIMSDMSLPEVQEARGSIFRQNEDGYWVCVCHPFDKFFNYGEAQSAVNRIDWSTASVQQKVDGSLIKMWYDYDGWVISTNGTINAFKAECGDTTYGALVEQVIDRIPNFLKMLDRDYTYMFELTSPFNRIVIRYEGVNLWYLGRRNILTDEEDSEGLRLEGLLYPEVYPHHSLSECIAAAHEMGDDEEGYVVCDANFNRIKIKGDEYLLLHKMRGNGPLTIARVIEMWQADSLDDFTAYYPEFKPFVDKVMGQVRHLIEIADIAFASIMSHSLETRADFARYACSYIGPVKSFLFTRYDDKVANATDFYKGMRAKNLSAHLQSILNIEEVGVKEDE